MSLVTVNHRHFITLCVYIGHFTVTAVEEPNYPLTREGRKFGAIGIHAGSMNMGVGLGRREEV